METKRINYLKTITFALIALIIIFYSLYINVIASQTCQINFQIVKLEQPKVEIQIDITEINNSKFNISINNINLKLLNFNYDLSIDTLMLIANHKNLFMFNKTVSLNYGSFDYIKEKCRRKEWIDVDYLISFELVVKSVKFLIKKKKRVYHYCDLINFKS